MTGWAGKLLKYPGSPSDKRITTSSRPPPERTVSLEPQHHLAASATAFSAALAEYSSHGWAVQRSTVGRAEIAVVTGPMGVVITGGPSVEVRTLHTCAGRTCAALAPALRRHVLVVEPGAEVDLAALPTVLTGDQVDLAAAAVADQADAQAFTVATVLEWTRHAQPEPARSRRSSPLEVPAAWLTRHAPLVAVIVLGVAMLFVVDPGGTAAHPPMTGIQTPTISADAEDGRDGDDLPDSSPRP